MNDKRKKELEDKGWSVGSVADFLNLSPEEQKEVERRVRREKKKKEKKDD
jgi:hypothetical protein